MHKFSNAQFPFMRLAARDLKYNINRTQNLIHLPTSEPLALSKNLPLHTGGHLDSYYDYVYEKLNNLQKAFNKGELKRSALPSEIEAVENEIRKDLMNRERKAMLQENDPHHR
jgi:A nuclease family of the HNH/ENDO VII superfamily with conserved AHH